MSITLLHENCPLTAADDKKLPYTAYVITYKLEGKEVHDLAIANKEVDLFDHYYDCLLYTSPSPRDRTRSRMPSSA